MKPRRGALAKQKRKCKLCHAWKYSVTRVPRRGLLCRGCQEVIE